ncbi:MAG: glutamine amidotransferase-related protein, partial [Bilophila wadsworthia]
MFLLIDNYDSFTYNLVQAFYALGQDPVVVKNDDPRLLELAQDPSLNMVCLSRPRPSQGRRILHGSPPHPRSQSPGARRLPGHQALGLAAGAKSWSGPASCTARHPKSHDGSGLFSGVPNPMRVGRYHSLVVRSDVDEAHAKFTVTAHGPEGEIMALRYKDRPWVGVQFHPESILTPDGLRLLGNFPKAILPAGNDANAINVILDTLASGQDLTADMASAGFSALMDGTMTPS